MYLLTLSRNTKKEISETVCHKYDSLWSTKRSVTSGTVFDQWDHLWPMRQSVTNEKTLFYMFENMKIVED